MSDDRELELPSETGADPSKSAQPAHAADAKAVKRADRAAQRESAQAEKNRQAALVADQKAQQRALKAQRGPGVWKTWVLPSLKVLVAAVIAIALVKIAFFPENNVQASGDVPTANMQEPTIAVSVGTVVNDLVLQGSIVQDAATPVRSTVTGVVTRLWASEGQAVARGDNLYTVRSEKTPTQPAPDAEGNPVAPSEPTYQYTLITAPTAGTLTGFSLLLMQQVEIGTETGGVQPGSFHVEAPLKPEQQYRLVTQPETAEVAIEGGPAPFTCTNARIASAAPAPSGQGAESTQQSSSVALHCAVPVETRVFAGLSAKVTIHAGKAEDVLVLPTTAVVGSTDQGKVFVPQADGEPSEMVVTLGLNDGTNVEVSGIEEGTEVLQFAPGNEQADSCADPATADPAQCGQMP